MSGRATGRTTRQLERLPDGGVYVVMSPAMIRECQELMHKHGMADKHIRVVPYDHLEPYTQRWGECIWDADHDVLEKALLMDRLPKVNPIPRALNFARINFRSRELSAQEDDNG